MIQGILTPNLVPFRADESINEDELRRMVNWLIEKGVSGLYPNGSTGEFIRLSFEERKRVIQIVAQENRLSRLTVSGALDKNFGEFFSTSQFHVVPLPDGKFAGAGQAANSEGYLDYALFRFNSNGTLDHSFDGDGITSLPPTGSTRGAEDLVAQSDGKLIGIGADRRTA